MCFRGSPARPASIVPSGYTHLGIAVIQASHASSFEDADRILREVTLTPKDFRWLEDVRTLATAAAAHRFGDVEAERTCRDAFLRRQPMLFEPDHAVNFLLLRYQERLKPGVLSSFSGQESRG